MAYNNGPKTGNLTKEQLISDYRQLGSINKVAKKHGVCIDTMSAKFRALNIPYKPKTVWNINHNIFSEETEISFYLAGFIAADGSIGKYGYSHYLNIWLSKDDLNHLELIHKYLDTNIPIKKRISKGGWVERHWIIPTTTCGFAIASKQIYEDLLKNFCITPDKSLTLKFPRHLSNHKYIHHFIRGYFDGDGSFSSIKATKSNKKNCEHFSFELLGTKHFLSQIRAILIDNLSIHPNKITQIHNMYRLRYSGNRLISLIGDYLYKDATIYLDRKYQKYLLAKDLLSKFGSPHLFDT